MTAVAMLQVRVDADESVDARIDRVLAMTAEAMHGVDMVVLPELWTTGAFDLELGIANREQIPGALSERLAELAARNSTWLHAGSIVERDGDNCYNTSLVIDAAGNLAAAYRKIHLFGFDEGEAALVAAGHEAVVVETPLGLTGLATCYDLRFPELFRLLVERGATSIIVSASWPARRVAAWQSMIPVRAAENQCFVFGCNATGTHAGVELAGRSLVADPMGEIMQQGGTGEELITAEVDLDQVRKLRAEFPVLRDRKLGVTLDLN